MRHYTSDAFFVTSDNHRLCKLVRRQSMSEIKHQIFISSTYIDLIDEKTKSCRKC